MAVGIGLVFGVLRLVNFAYGQLIMAGAYTLAFTSQSDWPIVAASSLCFAVVIALSLAMERLVFRPLRTQSPAMMLVDDVRDRFLLQSVALLIDVRDARSASRPPRSRTLNQAGHDRAASTSARSRSSRSSSRRVCARAARAAARPHDDRAAASAPRRPTSAPRACSASGANRVIGFAVLLSGVLAAAVAVLLTVQSPLVTPDFGSQETIFVLVGVVVGGHRPAAGRRRSAASRSASPPASRRRAADRADRQYLPSVVFALVILVLLLRPARAVRPRASGRGGARMSGSACARCSSARRCSSSRRRSSAAFVSPRDRARVPQRARRRRDRRRALRLRRQLGRALVRPHQLRRRRRVPGRRPDGAAESKPGVLPDLFPLLRDHDVGNVPSLALAAAVGGVFALARRDAADAPVGARGRHRDVRRARDHAQRAPLLDEDRPGRDGALARARDDRPARRRRSAR